MSATVNRSLALIAGATAGLFLAAAGHAAELKSPEMVKTGLRILASVYADMDRKLAADQFDRLPHENQEFQEGSGALRDAIANEPAGFKAQVQSSLASTLTAANQVAEVSKSHDKAKVQSALSALAVSMRSLNALFPESVRVEPGSVEAPHHPPGAGGPPKTS
ncbi:MAG TPA: hypothetical protein VLW26_12445 [Steroidobacteraceae bacterium]|nr:hypothetical protein [Steroidobacteraceae bacterium]